MFEGLFGSMFDFNGDGKLDAFETAAECQFFHDVVLADDDSDSDDDLFGSYDNNDDI